MHKSLRKMGALLLTLAMLCTLLPLGAISVSAAATIQNADFETGSVGSLPTNWKAYDSTKQAQISNVDAHNGSQAAMLAWRNQRFVLYQDVAVEKNYSYTVSFWYRSTRTSSSQGTTVTYTFGAYDTAATGNVAGSGGTYIDSAATEITTDYHKGSWTQMTYTFNSGSATTARLGFAGASSSSTFTAADGHILVDDLTITGTPIGGGDEGGDEGEQGEAIYTDDFEAGIDGWSGGGDGTVELVTASDLPVANANGGNNAMKITSVYYNYFSDKASFKVERDTDYIFTFDILSCSAGRPVKAIVGTNSWFSTQVVVETYTPVTTEWQTISVKFNSGSNTTLYLGWQASWDTGTYYVDNVSVTKAPEVEETDNLVLNGSFEDDEANWNIKNCTHSIVSDAIDGTKALQISNMTGQYVEAALSNVITTTPGNIYTIKWWSKRISNDTAAFNLYINGSHTKVSGQNWMNKAASAGWVEHEYVIKANDDCRSIQLKFSTEVSGGNPGTIIIDNVQVIEQKQPSFDGWLYNGDFECGEHTNWEVHQSTEVSRDAAKTGKYGLNLKGDGSYGGMANQTITTEVGKIYLLSMWMKANSNGTNFKVADANGEKLAYTWFNKTEWTYQEFEFTATTTSTLLNFSGAGNGTAEDVYVDDMRVVELKDPSFDGYLYNGDFEAGSLVKWKSYQSTALSASAAHSGNYGAHIYGDANWGGLLNQTIAVEAGKTYKISFWYRGWSNGVNFNIKNGDDKLVSKYFSFKYASGWEYYEATFEAGYATSLQITFSGSGLATTTAGQGTHDECYLDDVKIENLSCDEIDRNTLTTSGGASVRDPEDGNRGLAFKFMLDVNDIEILNTNEYKPGTGKLNLFKYSDEVGNLVKFGAVVTNDASIGSGDFTLADVNGKKVIDIPAKYLMEADEVSTSYAVRIINIPDNGVGTTIYARPYYTYELNGEEVTVYGTTESDSYDHVANIRRSVKILAIGNSFSVDAMKNHMYDMFKSADYDQVILGNLYIGGCSLDTHWNNLNGNLSAYQYQKNDDNGEWVYTENATALSALQDEDWDIITIQQASPDSGMADTYGNLQNIVNWVNDNKTNTNAKVLWHMTWAYQQNSDHEGFANYGNDQMTMYNAIVNAVQSKVLTANGIDGVIPAGTAIQNLRTSGLGDTLTADGYHLKDTYGDYTAALTWFRAITGESLDLVTYWPDSVKGYKADIMQAAARAVYAPYEVSDLSETIILGLSDFQASTDEKSAAQVENILNGGIADHYGMFDGMFAVGDYSAQMGYDVALTGIEALDQAIDPFVSGNKIYAEGNHDAPDLPGLSPTGNNDPAGGKYGVFVINEEDYDQFGEGGEASAAAMQAYFNEKLADPTWGNKPIFVLCHVPLHYSMRTETSNSGKTARPMVDVLNEAGANGLNILFLFGHNHSGGYDDFLGAGSVYLKKGDQMIVPQYGANFKYNWDEVTLNFTYMNVGYVGYNADNGYGADTALTVTTYRIKADGSVIITRWDEQGVHNLKSAGVKNTVLMDTFDPNLTVYESSRIVTADDDRKYEGN